MILQIQFLGFYVQRRLFFFKSVKKAGNIFLIQLRICTNLILLQHIPIENCVDSIGSNLSHLAEVDFFYCMGSIMENLGSPSSTISWGFTHFTIDPSHPLYVHPSDSPGSQLVLVPFNGCGFVL